MNPGSIETNEGLALKKEAIVTTVLDKIWDTNTNVFTSINKSSHKVLKLIFKILGFSLKHSFDKVSNKMHIIRYKTHVTIR